MCTASLTLAPPRLIQGRGAACHWMSRDLLRRFGAEPLAERVVIDGKFISGGRLPLMVEYDAPPPFNGRRAGASAPPFLKQAPPCPMCRHHGGASRRARLAGSR